MHEPMTYDHIEVAFEGTGEDETMPQMQDFEEYHRAEDGEYATWRVQSNRLAQSIAEASEDEWECLSIVPYLLTTNGNTSTVSEYLLLLWKEA